MCSCSSCYGYKPGKGGGWIFVVMLLLLLSLPFHGMLTVLLIAALWPWLLGALGLWIAVRFVRSASRERPPEHPPEHDPDCHYRWACEDLDGPYRSCNCSLAEVE
jgi:hypothetical protein